MNYKRFHVFEKFQVVFAAGVLLSAVYFLVGRAFRPADPLGPLALLPMEGIGKCLSAIVLLLVLAALASACTTHSRPEGSVMAALIALGGLSLLSHSLRTLLWSYPGRIQGLYLQLVAEVLLLTVGVLLAEAVALFVRAQIERIRASWVWVSPLDHLSEAQRKALAQRKSELRWDAHLLESPTVMPASMRTTLLYNLLVLAGPARRQAEPAQRKALSEQWRRGGACLATGTLIGVILVTLLLRSTERGQILFALFTAFTLSALIAQHLFPTRFLFANWLMPVIASLVFYGLAAISGNGARPPFEALPIDWISAGCSGALLGCWITGRMRESRIFETRIRL
jgi:hypothetical protein